MEFSAHSYLTEFPQKSTLMKPASVSNIGSRSNTANRNDFSNKSTLNRIIRNYIKFSMKYICDIDCCSMRNPCIAAVIGFVCCFDNKTQYST